MRNANGYGSVVKLAGNRRNPWAVRKTIGWRDNEEKGTSYPIYKYISYHPTRKAAAQALAEFNKDPYVINNYTIKDVFEMWYEWHPEMHPDTDRKYQGAFRKLEPIHDLKMHSLTKTQLQDYFDELEVSKAILKHIRMLLNQLIDFSAKRGLIPDQTMFVMSKLDFVARKETRTVERNVFTKEEIDYLWENKDSEYCKLLLVYIYTGLRYSELKNLKEEDVDEERKCINIVKAKTLAGVRTVPLSDKVLSLLPIEPVPKYNTFRNRLLEMDDMFEKHHTIHDTRHTFISLMTEAGVDSRIIKQIVGHKDDDDVTESVYTHISLEKMLEAVNKI